MSVQPESVDSARRAVAFDFAVALPVLGSVVLIMALSLGLTAAFGLWVLAVYASVALLILLAVPGPFPGRGMGAANRVTLARLVLALPLVGLAVSGGGLSDAMRWWVVGLGTLALMLDGVDGWVARRTFTTSPFGARFDMETDAALLVVLGLLAWVSGQVGPWVLGIGAMRYIFVAAAWVVPRLSDPLFPSMRRKVVCVVQGIALLICVGPIVPRPLAQAVAGLALVALTGSFARDTIWLLSKRRSAQSAALAPSMTEVA